MDCFMMLKREFTAIESSVRIKSWKYNCPCDCGVRCSTKTNIVSVRDILQLMAHVDECVDYFHYFYVLTRAWCSLCV